MDAGENKSKRETGREMACEGLVRSQFGRRPSRAGDEALKKLRMSERRSADSGRIWSSTIFKAAAVAAAAVVLVIIIIYASAVPENTSRPAAPEDMAHKPQKRREIRVVEETQEPSVPEEKIPDIARKARPQDTQEKSEEFASVSDFTGKVRVKRGGVEEALREGVLFSIIPGDTVITEEAGQARLDLGSGDTVYLNSNARMSIAGGEEDGILLSVSSGEIYLEKDSEEGSVAVETGFGRVHTHKGRFGLERFDDKCLLSVVSGEVECLGRDENFHGKYDGSTRAWLHRGKGCGEGAKFDPEDMKWMAKMRSRRPHRRPGYGRHDGPPPPGMGPYRRGPRPPGPPDGKPPRRGRRMPDPEMFVEVCRRMVDDFAELDANGDGKLTPDEADGGERFLIFKLIEGFDENGDGGLSLEECKSMLEKMRSFADRYGPSGEERRGPSAPPDEKRDE